MTRREETIFTNELVELLTGDDDTSNKEFFERIICANTVIARCLSKFKDDYDEVDTKSAPTVKKDTPAPLYYVASVKAENIWKNLGFFTTFEKAQTRIIEYENTLNPSTTYYDWDEFIHDYCNNLTKITDYDIATEHPDS